MMTQKRLPYTTYSRHIFVKLIKEQKVGNKKLTITQSPKTHWITRHVTLATLVASERSS